MIYRHMPDPTGLGKVTAFPLENEKTLNFFLRDCYAPLYEKCMELWKPDGNRNICPIILLGTPGIGKTFFIYYVLSQEKKKKNRVYYQMTKNHLFLFDLNATNTVTEIFGRNVTSFLDQEYEGDTLFVIDAYRMSEAPYRKDNRVILITSPNKDTWYKFSKASLAKRLFMPLWTREEIADYNQEMGLGLSRDHLMDAWEKIGGTVRRLTETPLEPPPYEHSAGSLLMFLNRGIETNREESDVCHRLIHISVPTDENGNHMFQKFDFVFASDAIQMGMEGKLQNTKLNDLSLIFDLCSSGYSDHTMSGVVFEHVMHRVFERGGVFECRSLNAGSEEMMKIHLKKTGPAIVFQNEGDVLSPSFRNKYCVPRHHTFPAIDGVYHDYDATSGEEAGQVFLFQMTIRKDHPIKGMREALKYVRTYKHRVSASVVKGCSLIFVVPGSLKDHWTKRQKFGEGEEIKTPCSMPQYVMFVRKDVCNDGE